MKKIYLSILFFFLLLASVLFNFQQNENLMRLKSNQSALMSDIEQYRTADSLNAARAKSLTLTIGELKANNSQLADEVKAMGVKLKHLQGATAVQQTTKYVFEVDTVFVTDTLLPYPQPQYEYHDEWIDFKMLGGSVDIETRDSLVIVRYQKQRRFLWFTWSRQTPQVAVENRNPNAKIIGVSEVMITK